MESRRRPLVLPSGVATSGILEPSRALSLPAMCPAPEPPNSTSSLPNSKLPTVYSTPELLKICPAPELCRSPQYVPLPSLRTPPHHSQIPSSLQSIPLPSSSRSVPLPSSVAPRNMSRSRASELHLITPNLVISRVSLPFPSSPLPFPPLPLSRARPRPSAGLTFFQSVHFPSLPKSSAKVLQKFYPPNS